MLGPGMNVPDCKHRRWTRKPGLVQIHCFLKKKNRSVKQCVACKYINMELSDYKGYRPKRWTAAQPSRGFGDTIARVAHATGVARVVGALADVLGVDCGCCGRQAKLNKLFPYSVDTEQEK